MSDKDFPDWRSAPPIDRNRVVAVHLRHLAERLDRPQLRADDAIILSVSLRVLFEQGLIGRVANENTIDLTIQAPDVSQIPYSQALLFACGGYEACGVQCSPLYIYRQPGLKSPYRSQYDDWIERSPDRHELILMKFAQFEQSICLSFRGKAKTRRDVIDFVAHKCGGAHAFHRNDIRNFNPMEQDLSDMGKAWSRSDSDLNIVLSEIFGTAWFLIQSPSVIALQKKLSSVGAEIIQFPKPK
jgi:hypothetical protein